MASYGGGFYNSGYGKDPSGVRNIYKERINNLKKQAPKLKDINFYCKDYSKIHIEKFKDCVFYLDPPYKNTKKYTGQNIDYDYFYDFCRKLSEKNIVLISEYEMPDDFECIWSKKHKKMQDSNRILGKETVEKLFKFKSN